ncbi:MAG: reverse transcriptase family protein [Alphaproteobacteria bacterium]|jgi:hypothetical protein|nr:reverse transcriptase family protein [Alphaproteobacteria bacterium]
MKKENLKFYNINQSPLYKLSSKKKFYKLFQSNHSIINNQIISNIFSHLDNYLFKFKKDGRDFYELKKELKYINKKLFIFLSKIETPSYLFSKKGKSHIDNAKYHLGNNFLFKVDISQYFPSINKQKVFHFYRKHLKMSPDIAELLCKFTVFDNHLSQGLSTSPILSYLVNQDMFNKISSYIGNNLRMSVYVDDITFSSDVSIGKRTQDKIISIIESYGYKVKPEKIKYYKSGKHKKITGLIISKHNQLKIPNRIREKIIKQYPPKENNKNGKPKDIKQCQLGRIYFARIIEPNSFKKKLNELKNS